MLNKNDPLIGAVQEVMKKNQAERDAVKAVNEKFGVVDRRALPREQQANWDAAYKKVISEGVEVLNEELSPKQKQLAAIAGNKKKIDAPDLAAARAGKAKHIDEEQIDETSKEKAQRYISGAKKDINKHANIYGTSDKGKNIIRKRMSGMKMAAKKLEEDNVNEVLDTPGKRLKYYGKAIASGVKASITGDKKTEKKRESGLQMAKRKTEKDTEKRSMDAYRNKLAGEILDNMHKKANKLKEETVNEVAPPGREDQVKSLKKKVGTEKAFKFAWASYNKKKGK